MKILILITLFSEALEEYWVMDIIYLEKIPAPTLTTHHLKHKLNRRNANGVKRKMSAESMSRKRPISKKAKAKD